MKKTKSFIGFAVALLIYVLNCALVAKAIETGHWIFGIVMFVVAIWGWGIVEKFYSYMREALKGKTNEKSVEN